MIRLKNVEWIISESFKMSVFDLKLDSGVYLVSGKNGSGKSVLLRGLSKSINLPELSVQNSCKKILYLTNEDITFPYLTIEENLKLNHSLFGIEQEADLRLFSKGQLETICNKASLGMRQKVGLSLSLVRNYWDLIILDESAANLDIESRKLIFDELEMRANEGAIVLLVDHQFSEFERDFKVIEVREGVVCERE